MNERSRPYVERARALEALSAAADGYPTPLAQIASEIGFELAAARPDFMRVFLLEIDLFEASVAFFAFIQLSAIDRAGVEASASREAIANLRSNPHMCTGHWWALLRETSRDVGGAAKDVAPVARQLAAIHFLDGGKTARLGALLDEVPGLRNRVKGHAWTLPADAYEPIALRLLDRLAVFLSGLGELADFRLVVVRACEPHEPGFSVDLVQLRGDRRRPHRSAVDCEEPLSIGHVYLVARADLATGIPKGGALPLHPFVQSRRGTTADATLLLQGLGDGPAKLLTVVGSEASTCETSGAEARRVLDRVLSRASRGPFAELRDRAAAVTRGNLAKRAALLSYQSDQYLVRPPIVERVEHLVRGPSNTVVLSGPSGYGKTALVCHVAERWLLAEQKDRAVVLAFAPELAAHGESLDGFLERRLGATLARIGALAAEASASLLVIVDGLDRTSSPVDALEEVVAIARGPGVQVLVTGTDVLLAEYDRRVVARGGTSPLERLVLPPLDRDEALAIYELCRTGSPSPSRDQEPEARNAAAIRSAALPLHLLEALRSPLFVRLAVRVFARGESTSVTPGRLLQAFTTETIFHDLARAELTCRLVDRMLATSSKSVPVDLLAEDAWLRWAVLSAGADGPLAGLVRDQVLSVEWTQSPDARLPMPRQARLSITFDLLLDYLVLTRLLPHAEPPTAATLAGIAERASSFTPVLGALRLYCIERLSEGPTPAALDDARAVLRALPPAARGGLVGELLYSGLELAEGGAVDRALTDLFAALPAPERGALLKVAEQAMARHASACRPAEASAVARLAARLGARSNPNEVLPIVLAHVDLLLRTEGASAAANAIELALELAGDDPCSVIEVMAAKANMLGVLGSYDELAEAQRMLRAWAARTDTLTTRAKLACAIAEARSARVTDGASRKTASTSRRAALELARGLASELGDERAHIAVTIRRAEAELDDLESFGGGREQDAEAPALETLDDELQRATASARRLGAFALEAEAHGVLARRAIGDPERQLAALARSLEAARLARDPSIEARALRARATLEIKMGRFDDGEQDALQAAQAFGRLGYARAHLKTLQHAVAIVHWELGRPGRALDVWRTLRSEAEAIGSVDEAALAALLTAELACDLGDPTSARALADAAQQLIDRSRRRGWLNFDLVIGHILLLEGDREGALRRFESARAWGRGIGFPDFVYQPGIRGARALLEPRPAREEDLERAEKLIRDVFEDSAVARELRARYEGELSHLHALTAFRRGNLEEARVWCGRAREWFDGHAGHRTAPEAAALAVVLDARAVEVLEREAQTVQGPARSRALGQAAKLREGGARTLAGQVRAPLERAVQSFSDPRDGLRWRDAHPATALLREWGIE